MGVVVVLRRIGLWRRARVGSVRVLALLSAICMFGLPKVSNAQWVTEEIELKAGWNGVFLHVDPSHLDLDSWIGDDSGSPITQVWRWNQPSTVQFYDHPGDATFNVSGWAQWNRFDPDSVLQRMVGDTAYLVESASNYMWQVQGRPVVPRPNWNIEGLNLIGFPTTPGNPPDFDEFLGKAGELQSTEVKVYRYQGDSLSENPQEIPSSLHRYIAVQRGEAFWVSAGDVFNKYFGPFEVSLSGTDGINFYDNLSSASLRLRNLTDGPLTITMALVASDAAPDGQPVIAASPTLLVRDALDLETLNYGFTELPVGETVSWTLQPRDAEGSEVEVVLGLDRSAITEDVGSLLAGILKFTDSLGHIEVNVPVSCTVASDKGLWVGEAMVTQVGQYLKSYQSTTNPILTEIGSTVVTNDRFIGTTYITNSVNNITTNQSYIVTDINTDITDVPKMFPLRLIVHSPSDGDPVLLQRVFSGIGTYSNQVLSRKEAALDPDQLTDARRISAVHLPWSEDNAGWDFDGDLEAGSLIETTVATAYNDHQSNPFLHTYHPDHDNLDARFENEVDQGGESYRIEREIRLLPDPVGTNFSDRVSGNQRLIGNYQETIRLIGLPQAGGQNDTRTFEVRGVFRLDRISEIDVLTDPL